MGNVWWGEGVLHSLFLVFLAMTPFLPLPSFLVRKLVSLLSHGLCTQLSHFPHSKPPLKEELCPSTDPSPKQTF